MVAGGAPRMRHHGSHLRNFRRAVVVTGPGGRPPALHLMSSSVTPTACTGSLRPATKANGTSSWPDLSLDSAARPGSVRPVRAR
jgi:hypothetical protein